MAKTKCTAIRSVLVIFATAAKYAFDVGDLIVVQLMQLIQKI